MDHRNRFELISTELQLRERNLKATNVFHPQTTLQHLQRSHRKLLPKTALITNTFLGIQFFAGEEGCRMLEIDLSTLRAASSWCYPLCSFLYTRKSTFCPTLTMASLMIWFRGPYLSQHVSPAVPFFFAYLFFICISSFVHASVTDPGVSLE